MNWLDQRLSKSQTIDFNDTRQAQKVEKALVL